MKCLTCNDTGYIEIIINPECHYDGWEEPIIEKQPCEDCELNKEKP